MTRLTTKYKPEFEYYKNNQFSLDFTINYFNRRPYKCATCSKDFASKYTLTAHMKIHSERRRPFDCDQCLKSFFSQQNLTQHQRTHTGIKEFVCDVCDKAFGTAHNLDVHRIVHTGYKVCILIT